MRIRKQQSGFAVVELVLVIVILATIGFVGWRVYQKHNKAPVTAVSTSSNQSPVAQNVSTAPPVNTTKDLDTALDSLNQNDPSAANSSDSSQLSSQSDF